jgi:hypothetical protein
VLAGYFEEALGLDPDAEMVARIKIAPNSIRWVQAFAEDNGPNRLTIDD